MGFALLVPATDGFRGQLSFGHVFGAVEEVAGQGDGDAPLEGVEPTDLLELLTEHLASAFEQEHVRFAIGHEFLLKVEDVLGIVRVVPLVEFSSSFDRHAFGIVVGLVG